MARRSFSVLANVDRMADLYDQVAYCLVENDSQDATKQVQRDWQRRHSNVEIVCLDGLDSQFTPRTKRLEVARNAYIAPIESQDSLRAYDHLIVLDMDEWDRRGCALLQPYNMEVGPLPSL